MSPREIEIFFAALKLSYPKAIDPQKYRVFSLKITISNKKIKFFRLMYASHFSNSCIFFININEITEGIVYSSTQLDFVNYSDVLKLHNKYIYERAFKKANSLISWSKALYGATFANYILECVYNYSSSAHVIHSAYYSIIDNINNAYNINHLGGISLAIITKIVIIESVPRTASQTRIH